MAVGFEPMPQNKADRGVVVGDQDGGARARFLDPLGEVLIRVALAPMVVVLTGYNRNSKFDLVANGAGIVISKACFRGRRQAWKGDAIHWLVVSRRPNYQG